MLKKLVFYLAVKRGSLALYYCFARGDLFSNPLGPSGVANLMKLQQLHAIIMRLNVSGSPTNIIHLV